MVYVPKASSGIGAPLMPTSYPTRVVAGHAMVDLPGGWFVQGSAKYGPDQTRTPPYWTRLLPFSAAVSPVSEAQYRSVIGADDVRGGNPKSAPELPVTRVSWEQAVAYCRAVNAAHGTQIGLLSEAQWEYTGRGPAVDLRAVVAANGIAPSGFADFVEERFENFVTAFEPGARIFMDPQDEELQRLLQTSAPLYAWCVYAPAGPLTKETSWHDRQRLPSANWGPANGFGARLMTGGVWEWCANTYSPHATYRTSYVEAPICLTSDPRSARSMRGGSCHVPNYDGNLYYLRLASRIPGHPRGMGENLGFRVGAPQDSPA